MFEGRQKLVSERALMKGKCEKIKIREDELKEKEEQFEEMRSIKEEQLHQNFQTSNQSLIKEQYKTIQTREKELKEIVFTKERVIKMIEGLKERSTPGPDQIPNKLLKEVKKERFHVGKDQFSTLKHVESVRRKGEQLCM